MSKIAFLFSTVESDFPLAIRLVNQINTFYPESRIIAISDGRITDFHSLGKYSENIVLVEGETLKYSGVMGLFTIRSFQAALSFSDSEFIIKLDPDSFLKRRFKNIPDSDWAGNINSGSFTWGYCAWCKGGGYLIKRTAIEKIIDSKLLLHSRYNVLQSFELSTDRIYEDCRLGHVANELNIIPTDWDEVNCGKFLIKDKRSRNKALVHPVKG